MKTPQNHSKNLEMASLRTSLVIDPKPTPNLTYYFGFRLGTANNFFPRENTFNYRLPSLCHYPDRNLPNIPENITYVYYESPYHTPRVIFGHYPSKLRVDLVHDVTKILNRYFDNKGVAVI